MQRLRHSIREFEHRLKLFVTARTNGSSDVDDIVQEAFLRYHTKPADAVVENPLGYLYRIALNIIIDRRRQRSPLTSSVELDAVSERWFAAPPTQEQGRSLADLERAYHAALAELPPRCAEVYALRRHSGMATPDVADRLSITPRMVQKHMATAMAHLHDRLAPFLFDDHRDGDGGGANVPVRCQMTSSSTAHA